MTELSRAVFLSYASQDAEAARSICAALQGGGIEVWFDQSELRGGDSWDRQIFKQIRECALFVPVISLNTQARLEGYFRREWRLAVDRTRDMADGKPFLVPVVIDGTNDRDATVPDLFRSVQWTRLPAGETPPTFVAHILRLLSPERQTEVASQRVTDSVAGRPAGAAGLGQPTPGSGGSSRARIALLVAAAVAVAAAILAASYFAGDKLSSKPVADALRTPASSVHAVAPAAQPAASVQSVIPEKSIAVLPFLDMSEKKDQEYFSDGLTEELLDLLAQVPDLRVSARTSSFYFKGRNEDLANIAQKLKVAHVLEGSVRKAGPTMRVTAQLIRADNGYHLWSKSYDRDVKDVFKVQDEIAAAVVTELKAHLLPATQVLGARHAASSEAHNQYLLGRQFLSRTNGRDMRRAVESFRRAVELAPDYAAAWAGIADASYWVADDEESSTARDADLQQALSAADKAIALQPALAYGYVARGQLRASIQWDFAGADQDFQRAAKLEPDSIDVSKNYADSVLIPAGRLDEAVARLRKIIESDPLNAGGWSVLGAALAYRGNLAGAREALNRSLEISPEQIYTPNLLAQIFLVEGQPGKALEASQRSSSEYFRLFGRVIAQYDLGNHRASDRALEQLIAKYASSAAVQIAQAYAWRGDKDQAFVWLERAYAQRDAGLAYVKVHLMLRKLKGDARFTALLRKINLPE